MDNCYVYIKSGSYGYNFRTGAVYYDILFDINSMDAARSLIRSEEFSRFIYTDSYTENKNGISFVFKGGIDRKIFVDKEVCRGSAKRKKCSMSKWAGWLISGQAQPAKRGWWQAGWRKWKSEWSEKYL